MRRFKIAVCFALVLLLLFVPVVVYADDETTQAETSETSESSGSSETNHVLHIRTCRHWAGVLTDDGIINSDSYYYICYDTRNGGYNAFVSSSPFAFENYQAMVMQWYSAGNRYDWFASRSEIPNYIQICAYSNAYNGVFGGGGYLRCRSDVIQYHSEDGVFYSEVGSVLGASVSHYVEDYLIEQAGANFTFLEFGLNVPNITGEGFYSVCFEDVYANFVPYIYLDGTDVALNFGGFTVTGFDDIPSGNGGSGGSETSETSETSEISEESSFFQVSRIPQTMGLVLWQALPAAIIIATVILLLRLLRHFGVVR